MATGGGAFPIYSDSDKPPVNKSSVERSIALKYLPKKKKKKSKKRYSHHK
jgi:hypothetical protein